MEQSDKSAFIDKIKLMLFAVDGTHRPSAVMIQAYALALKKFTIEEVSEAIDFLISTMTEHISPAHIIQQIKGDNTKLSDSEKRSEAHADLAKPHWERMGYPNEEAYNEMNHKKWLEEQKEQ